MPKKTLNPAAAVWKPTAGSPKNDSAAAGGTTKPVGAKSGTRLKAHAQNSFAAALAKTPPQNKTAPQAPVKSTAISPVKPEDAPKSKPVAATTTQTKAETAHLAAEQKPLATSTPSSTSQSTLPTASVAPTAASANTAAAQPKPAIPVTGWGNKNALAAIKAAPTPQAVAKPPPLPSKHSQPAPGKGKTPQKQAAGRVAKGPSQTGANGGNKSAGNRYKVASNVKDPRQPQQEIKHQTKQQQQLPPAANPSVPLPEKPAVPTPAPPVPKPSPVVSNWSNIAAKAPTAPPATSAPVQQWKKEEQAQKPKGSYSNANGKHHHHHQHTHSKEHHNNSNYHQQHNHHHHQHQHHNYQHHKKEHGKKIEVAEVALYNPGTESAEGAKRFTAQSLLEFRRLFMDTPEHWSTHDNSGPGGLKEWIWRSPTRIQDIELQIANPRNTKSYTYGDEMNETANEKQKIVAPQGELIRKEGSEDPNLFIDENGDEIYVKPLEVNDDTRWKPKVAEKGDTENNHVEEEDEAAILQRALLLLNKLTPTTFPKLAPQLVELIIATKSLLVEGLKLLITKAQQEPHFCPMYAQVCLTLSETPLPFVNEKKLGKTLKKLLLEECQHEFEVTTETKIKQAIDGMLDPSDEEEKRYRTNLVKRNYLGHMTFIGEIYKADLCSIKVMLMCLPVLLTGEVHMDDDDNEIDDDNIDEEKVECFVKLMTTIGLRLEEEAITQEQAGKSDYMDKLVKIWDRVTFLAKGDGTEIVSNRIKFMFLDLLELRENDWVARRKTETAKTLQEIHLEAAKELPRRSSSSSLRRGTSSGDMRVAPASVDKDGFTVFTNSPKIIRTQSQGTLRRSLSGGGGLTSAAGGPPLPPSFRRSTSDVAGNGATVSPYTSPYTRSPARIRAFAQKDSENFKKGFSALQDSLPFDSIAETKPSVREHEDSLSSDQLADTENSSPNREATPIDLDKCPASVKSILKEYLYNLDEEDAILSLQDVVQVNQPLAADRGAKCAETMIFFLMDSTTTNVEKCMKLLKKVSTSSNPVFTADDLLRGLQEPFEFLQDILIDAPLANKILVDIVAGLIYWGVLPPDVTFMTNLPQDFILSGDAAKLAFQILQRLEKMDSSKYSAVLMKQENLNAIENLMTSDEKEKFGSASKLLAEYQSV